MDKLNAIDIANKIICNISNIELIKSESRIEDYSKEDLMKLLLTKIGASCHQSDCLVSKVNTIVTSKVDTEK